MRTERFSFYPGGVSARRSGSLRSSTNLQCDSHHTISKPSTFPSTTCPPAFMDRGGRPPFQVGAAVHLSPFDDELGAACNPLGLGWCQDFLDSQTITDNGRWSDRVAICVGSLTMLAIGLCYGLMF
jgi:hypothetical protein